MRYRGDKWCLLARGACLALLALGTTATQLEAGSRAVPVERIVVAYQGGEFRILSRIPLEKVLPPSYDLPGKKGAVSGSWFELQAAEGTTLYRRPIPDPTRRTFDGPEKPGGPPVRHEAVLTSQVFSVLVPRLPQGASLVLYGPSPLAESRATAAVERTRLSLVDDKPDASEGGAR